jgi:transcription elongation factor GreB
MAKRKDETDFDAPQALDDAETLDGAGEDDEPEAEPSRAGPLYITPLGAERLRSELKTLLTVERPKVTAEVSAAAALGDRSENAEYIYGKRRLREIDRRLRFLQKRIENLTVIDPTEQKDQGRIFFGATVTVRNDDDEAQTTYQLVGPDETDLKTGKISVDSPVARALIGKRQGDTVTVMRPKGEVDFTIVRIRYV